MIAVPAIPRTLSGKVLEVPVKRVLMGEPPERAASRESLANPEAFDWFVDYAGEHVKMGNSEAWSGSSPSSPPSPSAP